MYGRRGRCVRGEGGVWKEREVSGRKGRFVEGEGGVWEEREVSGRRGRYVGGEEGVCPPLPVPPLPSSPPIHPSSTTL